MLGRDNVTVVGAGYRSFIKNTTPLGNYDSSLANTAIFKLGGYESEIPWRVDDEKFYDYGDKFAGEYTVPVNITKPEDNLTVGDIIFIRSAAQESHLSHVPHNIPFFTEMNEVIEVDEHSGLVKLKYSLHDNFQATRIARSSGKTDPYGSNSIKVLKRFRVENLRMETPVDYAVGVFCFGGCFECEFRNLWLTRCTDAIMLNAISRCVFENIQVAYSGRLGEISYYSHHNLFRNIRASYIKVDGYPAGNGWACNEGAHDNTFQNILLNHGSAETRAWVLGPGRRNILINSEIITANNNSGAVIGIMVPNN